MITLPIYKICVSDTDKDAIKGFYKTGLQCLKGMLTGIIPDNGFKLEKVQSTGVYRASFLIYSPNEEGAIEIYQKLNELYETYKQIIYRQQNQEDS